MSKKITNGKMNRDEVFVKLDKGIILYSLTTKNLYKKINGDLMKSTQTIDGKRNDWEESDLLFLFQPSWEKMRIYDPKNKTHLPKKKEKPFKKDDVC